jgi:hypothetical protein
MNSISQLEKLIQIATIEQMFELIQKMKNNIGEDKDKDKDLDKTDSTKNFNKKLDKNSEDIEELQNKLKSVNSLVNNLNTSNQTCCVIIERLLVRIGNLEKQLSDLQNDKENNNQYLCAQLRGQQLLTSYPGFSKEVKNVRSEEEENIRLKIEEKNLQHPNTPESEEEELESVDYPQEEIKMELHVEEAEDAAEEEAAEDAAEEEEAAEEEAAEEEAAEEAEEAAEEAEEAAEEAEEAAEEAEAEEAEAEEEEAEEEVEVQEELIEESIIQNEHKKEEVEEEVEEEEEEEESEAEVGSVEESITLDNVKPNEVGVEEEEEEEVFEIEIDDVTYFTTNEENGILYEATSDGEIGKKVGIIKDGEPIFN